MRSSLSDDAARALVMDLPASVLTKRIDGKQVLEPLQRGSAARSLTVRDVAVLASEYPHLALAMLAPHLDEAVRSAEADIADIRSTIETIGAVRDATTGGEAR